MHWFPDDDTGFVIEVTFTGYYATDRNSTAIHAAEVRIAFNIRENNT